MPLKLMHRDGSKLWYIRGTVRKRRVFESTGTEDRALAEAYRAKREAELFEAAVFGKRASISFRRVALSYLAYGQRSKNDQCKVDKLIKHFGDLACDSIHQVEVDRAVEAIVGSDAAPSTKVRSVHTPLTAILNYAARRKWCEAPRFQRPPVPKSVTLWLQPRHALALIDAASPHLQPLLRFLCCTGARLSEAIDLQWADVDLTASRATFRDTKNGKDRVAALPDAAVLTLANLPHRLGPVFLRDDGRPFEDRERQSGGQIRTAWKTACKRARLMEWAEARHVIDEAGGAYTAVSWVPSITPHDLRHSWASWFYAVTKDPLLLKAEGGWHSLQMIERYAHLAPSSIIDEVRLVWGDRHPRIGVLPGANLVHSIFGTSNIAR